MDVQRDRRGSSWGVLTVGVAAALLAQSLVAPGVHAAPVEPEAAEGSTGSSDSAAPDDAWSAPAEANRTVVGAEPVGTWEPGTPAGARAESAPAPSGEVSAMGVPVGTPVGAPGLGALPFMAFEDYALTARTTASVNVANGNLLVRGEDVAVNAPGVTMRLDRFYNGLSSSAGAFGVGWTLSTGRDVGLVVTTTSATFTGPSGFTRVFPRSGSVFTTPPGSRPTSRPTPTAPTR